MIKLFKYELKRLLFNKFFIGLFIISAIYSLKTMEGEIILGVADTAPFSIWSYGTYLAMVSPILLIALLFFISFLYSKQEKMVQVLTDATQIDPLHFKLLRYGAITTAFILISIVPIAISLLFYSVNFHYANFGGFVLPTVMTLLPAVLFVLGIGTFAGRLHPALIFVLMPLILLLGYIPIHYSADLLCMSFFSIYPITLGTVEPPFTIPASVFIGRLAYCLAGIALMIYAALKRKRSRI